MKAVPKLFRKGGASPSSFLHCEVQCALQPQLQGLLSTSIVDSFALQHETHKTSHVTLICRPVICWSYWSLARSCTETRCKPEAQTPCAVNIKPESLKLTSGVPLHAHGAWNLGWVPQSSGSFVLSCSVSARGWIP